ncbi:MAG: hypothetical protein K0U59_09690 [Gammaproteobacteria bacterium]|nr:hypothetical protein [Gammaproteobacteria bacterium]
MALKNWLFVVILILGSSSFSVAEDLYEFASNEKRKVDGFTVLNWNAHEMGNNNNYPFTKVREVLLSQNPDFVTLQEVKNCSTGFYNLLRQNINFDSESMFCAQSQAYRW